MFPFFRQTSTFMLTFSDVTGSMLRWDRGDIIKQTNQKPVGLSTCRLCGSNQLGIVLVALWKVEVGKNDNPFMSSPNMITFQSLLHCCFISYPWMDYPSEFINFVTTLIEFKLNKSAQQPHKQPTGTTRTNTLTAPDPRADARHNR